jgi:hypothetical protein
MSTINKMTLDAIPAAEDPTLDRTPPLVTSAKAAKAWHRHVRDIYQEIEDHDYREEQGVFFRHLAKSQWRLNHFQYLYWRQMPLSAANDARTVEMTDFLLRNMEPAITAQLQLRRLLLAEREAAAVRLEQLEKPVSAELASLPNGAKP